MDEPWIIHCIDMLLLFYSTPHNFVQGRHSLQCQPIQELQNTPALVRCLFRLPQCYNAEQALFQRNAKITPLCVVQEKLMAPIQVQRSRMSLMIRLRAEAQPLGFYQVTQASLSLFQPYAAKMAQRQQENTKVYKCLVSQQEPLAH